MTSLVRKLIEANQSKADCYSAAVDPEVLFQARIIASEELGSADLSKLVEAAKALLI